VGALQPYPAFGGSRPLFTVTVTPDDDVIDVLEHASGRRALVGQDGAVRLVAPDPSARPR
jgi:hypothetical protein